MESLYIGVNNLAKEGKKGYIGIDGKARKIKRIYIGDANGKAKEIFKTVDLTLEYGYNKVALSEAKMHLNSTKNYKYGLFAGGYYLSQGNNILSTKIDCFDNNLAKSVLTLSAPLLYAGGVDNGTYAMFAGGTSSTVSGSANISDILCYDTALTKTVLTQASGNGLSPADRDLVGGNINNEYALLMGGSNYKQTALVYSKTLTKSTITSLPSTYNVYNSGNFGSKLLVIISNKRANVFNKNLTVSTLNLANERYSSAIARAGNYLLIAGGYVGNEASTSLIDIYDSNLTKISNYYHLSSARTSHNAETISDRAIFGGNGVESVWSFDIFDRNLTKTTQSPKFQHYTLSSTVAGKYALFAGGYYASSSWADVVDSITFK